MPKLVCRSCGQGVYTTAPFEQLFAEERRCPRCTQLLFNDRRSGATRRKAQRRRPVAVESALGAAPQTNGAPKNRSSNGVAGHEDASASEMARDVPVGVLLAVEADRRSGDRRQIRRRRDDNNPFQRASEEAGWAG